MPLSRSLVRQSSYNPFIGCAVVGAVAAMKSLKKRQDHFGGATSPTMEMAIVSPTTSPKASALHEKRQSFVGSDMRRLSSKIDVSGLHHHQKDASMTTSKSFVKRKSITEKDVHTTSSRLDLSGLVEDVPEPMNVKKHPDHSLSPSKSSMKSPAGMGGRKPKSGVKLSVSLPRDGSPDNGSGLVVGLPSQKDRPRVVGQWRAHTDMILCTQCIADPLSVMTTSLDASTRVWSLVVRGCYLTDVTLFVIRGLWVQGHPTGIVSEQRTTSWLLDHLRSKWLFAPNLAKRNEQNTERGVFVVRFRCV